MGCLVGEFLSWAPAKGAVIVQGVEPDGGVGVYGNEPPPGALMPGQPVQVVVNRLELAGLEPLVRPVKPLEGTGSGLFRTFAALPDQAVAEFASRYGWLGVLMVVVDTADGRRVTGEVLDRWLQERAALADAVELWALLRRQNVARLRPFVDAHPYGRYWKHTAGDDVAPGWTGGVVEQGWQLLQDMFWRHLVMSAGRVAARIDMQPAPDRPLALRIVSDSLLGALWLQFALAVDGDREYRSCETCGQFFELNPATARTNRRYCSDACRSKAYRIRMGGRD